MDQSEKVRNLVSGHYMQYLPNRITVPYDKERQDLANRIDSLLKERNKDMTTLQQQLQTIRDEIVHLVPAQRIRLYKNVGDEDDGFQGVYETVYKVQALSIIDKHILEVKGETEDYYRGMNKVKNIIFKVIAKYSNELQDRKVEK